MDDELWEVVLENVIGCEPFFHQKIDGWSRQFEEDEQCLFALGGYLVRRIQTWTPQVAKEFARECALEARQRALRAVRDATWVLGESHITEPAIHRSKMVKRSSDFPPPPEPRALEREGVLLRHAERMLSIWQRAFAVDGSPAQVASAYASAAAASRAAVALTYVTAIDSADASAAAAAGASACAEERRRQARWLQERLGLRELGAGDVATDVASQERRKRHATLSGV